MNVIDKIFWKRTYLFIEYHSNSPINICLKNRDSGRKVYLETKDLYNDQYRAKLNITIANGRNLLEAGSWEIIEDKSDKPIPCSKCIVENSYVGQQIFRYTKRFYSYAFRLAPNGNSVTIENGHYMSVKKEKDEYIFKENFFN